MKRNLSDKIRSVTGEEMVEPDGSGGMRAIPAYVVVRNALLARRPGEDIKLEEQLARYKIAERVESDPSEVEFTAEEIALVKLLVAKNFAPAVTGFVAKLLEAD